VIVFRNTDVDVPFLRETDDQPPARWHGPGEGPAQYMSSTPSAAWAEFIRHQGITDPEDIAGIDRAMWAIEIPDDEPTAVPDLPPATLAGGTESYDACQAEARRIRAAGATRLVSPAASLLPGTPSGWRSDGELQPGGPRQEDTIVLYGPRPELVGWIAAAPGRPEPEIVARTRPL
jgi:hypothetical protein